MDNQAEINEDPGLELLVKASSDGKGLGDCIQCHRVMMFLALKGVDAKVTTIDLVRKPAFFKENYSGMKLPCLSHELPGGKRIIIDDAAEIEDHLEQHFPEPKLKFARGEDDGGAAKAEGRIFQKFSAYMRNKDSAADEKLKGFLLEELGRLDNFLGSSNKIPGSFLGGDSMMQPDCVLLPKLYQLQVALKFYKQDFEIPETYENVHAYLKSAEEEEIFTGTRCEADEVLLFWSSHGDQKKAQQFLRTRSGSTSIPKY
eukprot:Seg413.9 transcript_id=Seg413.9/GoldUCD/mRNA.D3Y31 product="Chloride intracellular channel protein 2" protein_id=Seg413.9/GoldUCD/D3Y31